MALLHFLVLIILGAYDALAKGPGEPVWLEDGSGHLRSRGLQHDLPETLSFNVKRLMASDVTLELTENKRLNENAPLFHVVHEQDGKQRLVKKEAKPINDVKFYQDRRTGGAFMVECKKASEGMCYRTVTGILDIDEEAFEIAPAPVPAKVSTRGFRGGEGHPNPHTLVRASEKRGMNRHMPEPGSMDFITLDKNMETRGMGTYQSDSKIPPEPQVGIVQTRSNADSGDDDWTPGSNGGIKKAPLPKVADVEDDIDQRFSSENVEEEERALVNKLRELIQGSKTETESLLQRLREKQGKRSKRASTPYALEILVVLDPSIWEKYSQEATNELNEWDATETYLRKRFAQIVNGMSMRYESIEDPEMDIYLTVSGYLIFQTSNSTSIPDQSIATESDSVDAGKYLGSLPAWAADLQGIPNKDHVLVFTNLDLYATNSSGYRFYGVAGMAYVGEVCRYNRVSINEDSDYYIVTSIASHELGHNLGAPHDGNPNDEVAKQCPADDKYIMNPGVIAFHSGEPYTLNVFRFSTCSITKFKGHVAYLDSINQNCLNNHENYEEYLQHTAKLPGELHTPQEQCQLIRGEKSVLACGSSPSNSEFCQYMYCLSSNGYCYSQTPARGTPCGNTPDKYWCMEGQCVLRDKVTAEPTTKKQTTLNPTTQEPETTTVTEKPTTSTEEATTTMKATTSTTYSTTTTEESTTTTDEPTTTTDEPTTSTYEPTTTTYEPTTTTYEPTTTTIEYTTSTYEPTTTTYEPTTTTIEYTTSTTEASTTTTDGCVDRGYYYMTCKDVDDYYFENYDILPAYWCGDSFWSVDQCCAYCEENRYYTTTEAPCQDVGYYAWSCKELRRHFGRINKKNPTYWCQDSFWRQRCCSTCMELGA